MKQKLPDKLSEPNKDIRKEIYKLYQAIFYSGLSDKRDKLMTYIFAWYPWSWRVVGISRGAVKRIEENDYYPLPKRLVRDHFLQDRSDTYKEMLTPQKPLEFNKWWDLFWKNDQTIIMTKEEHDKERHQVECHRLSWECGYFACNPLVGFRYRKTIEAAYLQGTKKYNWVEIETIKRNLN